jgi:hypothetical protein
MLQVFYLAVVYVCNGFQVFFGIFLQVFQTHVSSVSSVFFFMLQVLHPGCFKSRSGVADVAMAMHACFKCFICFRHLLLVFYLDISKVDLGKTHVAAVSASPWVTACA